MRIEGILILGMLGLNSIRDIRKREIYLWPTLVFGIAGFVCRIVLWGEYWPALLLSCLPGLLFLALARMLPEQLGAGDALVILSAGAWLPAEELLVWLCVSLFAAAVAAGILIMRKKQKKTLPFVPFLLMGRIIMIWLW